MFRHVTFQLACMLVVVFGLAACGQAVVTAPAPAPAAAAAKTLILGGSGGGTTLLKPIVAPFQASQSALVLDFLQGSSSGAAKQAVSEGSLDLAILMSTDIGSEQQSGLELAALANDPVAFALHPDLGVTNLSADQLRAIYLGQSTNWSEFGGPDAEIVVLARDEDEGTTKILRKALFGEAPWAAAAIVLTKASELTDAVKATPYSIGFGSFGGFVLNDLGESVITVDGVHPRDYAAGQYPFPARTLALMYQSESQAEVQPLIDYLKGDLARNEMMQIGIVPLP